MEGRHPQATTEKRFKRKFRHHYRTKRRSQWSENGEVSGMRRNAGRHALVVRIRVLSVIVILLASVGLVVRINTSVIVRLHGISVVAHAFAATAQSAVTD